MFKRKKSFDNLDSELDKFFHQSINYRVNKNKVVVVLDDNCEIVKFLRFLITECDVNLSVLHIRDIKSFNRRKKSLISRNVQAIIIDSKFIGNKEAISYIKEDMVGIPTFVNNCKPSTANVQNFGNVIAGEKLQETLVNYPHVFGLPADCRQFAQSYVA